MSEYKGGPLDELAKLFVEALRTDDPGEKKRLLDEWNEAIKRCNRVLMLKPEPLKEGSDRGKTIRGLECCTADLTEFHKDHFCDMCPYKSTDPEITYCFNKQDLMADALSLLKEQEQEISRLKLHVDCDAAEKLPSGCVGYGRGFNDDEPCETCKACEKYNGYGEE